MKNIVINGRVLLLPTNGIPRYASEIIRYFDNTVLEGYNIEIVIPEKNKPSLVLKNLKYISLPNSVMWDYTRAERYARKKKALYVNMASKGVLYKNSVATIFDIRPISYDSKPCDIRSLKYYVKFKCSIDLALKNARHIVTISDFCKKEIVKYSKKKNDEISVIGCGWNHILSIKEDDSIFADFPQIKKKNYFLSIGSVAPHKNFKWVVECAKRNGSEQFVIVGKTDTSLWADNTGEFNNNIIYVGYQSDEKLKSLLLNCKALVFPSLYEGFGIPPLEALGCGICPIVSDIPIMREVMGEQAIYIDPNGAVYDMNKVMQSGFELDKMWLDQYTWQNQGKKWLELFDCIC